MHYKDTRPKYKLISWIKHPILTYQAWSRRNWPVMDLDNEGNNCKWCGYDHHWNERQKISDLEAERIAPTNQATVKAFKTGEGE